MKRFLLLCSLLCIGLAARAQQFFNVRSTLHSYSANITSVIPLNDKYYCTGTCIDSTNTIPGTDSVWLVVGVKFAVFDGTGQKVRDTVYQEWGVRNTIATFQPTTKLLPDTTLLVAAFDIDTAQSHLLLLRFDTLGHRLNRWEYDKPAACLNAWTDTWHMIDFKPCENHGWLMLSLIACGDSTYAGNYMLLTKLDSSFNLLWQKEYGDLPHHNIPGALWVEPDGSGYVLGGTRTNTNLGSNTLLQQAELIKVDTGGNQLWVWQDNPTQLTGGINDLIRTKDGGYLYASQGGGEILYHLNNDNYWITAYHGWIEKLDSDRNVLWTKIIGSGFGQNNYSEQGRLIELPDSTIIAAGETTGSFAPADTLYFSTHGTLVHLTQDGDLIWHRTYEYQTDSLTHHFYDLKATDDGGYILGGEATDEFYQIYTAPIQRGWLVKVDSAGCLGPDDPQCQDLNAPALHYTANKSRLYPNPVSGNLQLAYQGNSNGQLHFTLTDLSGRMVLSQALTGSSGTHTFAVGSLSPGMYLYRLTESGIPILQGKLIKQ